MADQTEVERRLLISVHEEIRAGLGEEESIIPFDQWIKEALVARMIRESVAAGYEAGAKAMRERAAKECQKLLVARGAFGEMSYCADLAAAVRSLPLTEAGSPAPAPTEEFGQYPLTPYGQCLLDRFRVAIYSAKPLHNGKLSDPLAWMRNVACKVLEEVLRTPNTLNQAAPAGKEGNK